MLVVSPLAAAPALATVTYAVSPISEVSGGMPGQNAEVEQAVDPSGNYVYEEWIGQDWIGFSRSTDGGTHFGKPVRLRDSGGGWDPALAVADDGTVYAVFMVSRGNRSFPVVLASFDHGLTFPQLTALKPPRKSNWGDRDFVATGPNHTVYVTWDYGPYPAAVKLRCPSDGSCGFVGGDLNIVMQISTNGGESFGPISHLSPGYPAGGASSAPLLVERSGRIDVLYERNRVTRRKTYTLGAGSSYFTSSTDGGLTWSRPVKVGGRAGTMSPREWWIDGALGIDSRGDLYATWDTQRRRRDIGWLAYSTDHGATWSAPVRVTPDSAKVLHIVESAGGPPGVAYVAWLTDRGRGYAEYLRTFSLTRGWLSEPRRISLGFGKRGIWPGDTFGISTVSPDKVILSWGSATHATGGDSEIFAAPVAVRLG